VLGPGIGGLAARYLSRAAPGLVAGGLSLVNFASGWFILAASLQPERRGAERGIGLGAIVRGLRDRRLRPLMLVWGIFPFAFAGYTTAPPPPAGATPG